MPFNINVIPPDQRSPAHIAQHVEFYKRSMDTCRVHNPTDEDFVVYHDRNFSNEQWIVSSKNKDKGKGKGNADVPRYIAYRFLRQMGGKLIQEKSKREWDKIKGKYRREEWGMYEERLAIKTSDQSQWDEIIPKLFLGVVSRYQMNEPEEPERQEVKKTFSKAEAALENLGITDMEIGLNSDQTQQAKEDLINQVK